MSAAGRSIESEDIVHVDRLRQMPVEPGALRCFTIGVLTKTGQGEDDEAVATGQRPQPPTDFVPIHTG